MMLWYLLKKDILIIKKYVLNYAGCCGTYPAFYALACS